MTTVVVLVSLLLIIGTVVDVLFVGSVIVTSILLVSTVGFVKSVCCMISEVNRGIVVLFVLIEMTIPFCEISLYNVCSYTGMVCDVFENCKLTCVILL